ncbi:MAG: 4Fe-4S binding protein [Deltaproteobacteria bacterium]|nr:4Fe-4S binding protein [Deltaproteobacteria bacterium]
MQTKTVITRLSELPQAPTTIGTMAWNQTGDWRYVTPLVADKLAPCSQNCPAGIPIPRHLGDLTRGDAEGALVRLMALNPMPGLTGRLCYHPCQTKCVRRKIDRAISIQEVERFLGDSAAGAAMARNDAKDRRVVIIGSGPLGLACAFFLGCQGYGVTVLDPAGAPGGALLALLPEKLEPQVLSREIDRLLRMADIRLETGAVVDFDRLGELAPKGDLVILDPTGLPADFCPPGEAAACNPFGDDAVAGAIVSLQLPKNLAPFRAPMIAHYIAAGRLLAKKAAENLRGEGGAERAPEPPTQAVNPENIKIARFGAAGSAEEEGPGPETARDKMWAVKEAGRCLSCGTCNLCLQCVSYCPDASILPARGKATVAVDLDHCKGCGICAYECPRGVITMEDMSV